MSALIIALIFLFKVDAIKVGVICESLTSRNLDPNICLGAINWLSSDMRSSLAFVVNSLSYESLFTPLLIFLSISPLFLTTWWRKETVTLFVFSIIFMSPLFLIAIDWGRWIYILTFMLFCLVLVEDVDVNFKYRNIFTIVGIVYLTTWSILPCCVGGIGSGFIGALINYPQKIIDSSKWFL